MTHERLAVMMLIVDVPRKTYYVHRCIMSIIIMSNVCRLYCVHYLKTFEVLKGDTNTNTNTNTSTSSTTKYMLNMLCVVCCLYLLKTIF